MKKIYMYTSQDRKRENDITQLQKLAKEPYRLNFRRDISRLIHAPAFRRLQGKTQLFPCQESDFFRNRLTHSTEVAQLAESIAHRLNYLLKQNTDFSITRISPSVCRFASLAHDLGHPPFGHLGEQVLNLKMYGYGGFEGNAQTLRILTSLEEAEVHEENDPQLGLNLCYRSLASVLKYDKVLPQQQAEVEEEKEKLLLSKEGKLKKKPGLKRLHPQKGYYESEHTLVGRIKNRVAPGYPLEAKFKTVECAIMDIADDIANAVYDLEDAFRGGFCSPLEIISADADTWAATARKVAKSLREQDEYLEIDPSIERPDRPEITSDFIRSTVQEVIGVSSLPSQQEGSQNQSALEVAKAAYLMSEYYAKDGAARTSLISYLVGRFIRDVDIQLNENFPAMSRVYIKDTSKILVDALKHLTYELQVRSKKLRIVEIRGTEIVSVIFDALLDGEGHKLMPQCFVRDYIKGANEAERRRVLCDFVAGMTDRYALEFYGRLKSENAETIFKPF